MREKSLMHSLRQTGGGRDSPLMMHLHTCPDTSLLQLLWVSEHDMSWHLSVLCQCLHLQQLCPLSALRMM
jgi:hypothetical protein